MMVLATAVAIVDAQGTDTFLMVNAHGNTVFRVSEGITREDREFGLFRQQRIRPYTVYAVKGVKRPWDDREIAKQFRELCITAMEDMNAAAEEDEELESGTVELESVAYMLSRLNIRTMKTYDAPVTDKTLVREVEEGLKFIEFKHKVLRKWIEKHRQDIQDQLTEWD